MERDRSQTPTHTVILVAIAVCTALLRFCPTFVQQHGSSCVFHTLTRLNCPFCGMTRDFVAILHGQRPSLNRFSWVAAFTVYCAYPIFFGWAFARGRLALFHRPAVHRAVLAALVVMLVVNNLPH